MRVLQLLSSPALSGAENVAADICLMLAEEHEFAYCSPEGPVREALQDRGIDFIPISGLTVRGLRQVVRQFRPDLIHAHDVRATALAAAAGTGVPFISHLHVNSDDMRTLGPKAVVYALAARRAAAVVMVDQACFDGYALRRVLAERTTVLPNVVSAKRIDTLTGTAQSGGGFDVLFVGRITDQKDPVRVARVACAVLQRLDEARFGVVGDGPLLAQMQAVSQEMGVQDRTSYLGFLNAPYQIMKESKAMLMCSRFEGRPIAALEAMYLGLPIVSTPVDGMRDLVAPAVTGYLESEDDALVDALVRLIGDEGLRARTASAATERFHQLSDEAGYRDAIDKLYQRATPGRCGGGSCR